MATRTKTMMCRNFLAGGCKYGAKCNFAHNQSELQRSPCWYFNHGGCAKKADECIYSHIVDKTMRKPIHLQRPCIFFHLKTPGQCKKSDCKNDHDYVLSESEWNHHYPQDKRPVLVTQSSFQEKIKIDIKEYKVLPENKVSHTLTTDLTSPIAPVIQKYIKTSPDFLSCRWDQDENDDALYEKLKAYISH